jgi:hypothetical protein
MFLLSFCFFFKVEISNQKMIDAENEVLVLKRKHAASLRELTRELQTCKKQVIAIKLLNIKHNLRLK